MTLSDKILFENVSGVNEDEYRNLTVKDVKESIKELKEEFKGWVTLEKAINRIFGDALIDEKEVQIK